LLQKEVNTCFYLINQSVIVVLSARNNSKKLSKKLLLAFFELTISSEKFILTNVAKNYLATQPPEKTVGK